MESQLPNLPYDIVVDILGRLPSKSLLRFKCVCKHWLSTISHPNFSFKKRESIFVVSFGRQHHSLYSIDDEAFVEPFPKHLKEFWDRSAYTFISNSCNGLVLIGVDDSIFLFNPSTKFFSKVLTLDRLLDEGYGVVAGFCFGKDDYKAVIGLSHQTPHYGGDFVLVATLKRKRWEQFLFPSRVGSANQGPVVEGRLHWTASHADEYDHFSESSRIISFDPLTNNFQDLPIPDPKYREKNAIVGLGVLGGCLCMSRLDNQSGINGDVEVLEMKKYGVVESWITMFVISNLDVNPYYGHLPPMLLTKNGEVLLRINRCKILSYNPTQKLYRNLPIGTEDSIIIAVSFVQSLVSPIGYHWNRRRHRRRGRDIKWLYKKV